MTVVRILFTSREGKDSDRYVVLHTHVELKLSFYFFFLCIRLLSFLIQKQTINHEESATLMQKPEASVPVKKKRKGKEDLDELKQELEMDEHKVPIEELYERFGTDPNTVCDPPLTFH